MRSTSKKKKTSARRGAAGKRKGGSGSFALSIMRRLALCLCAAVICGVGAVYVHDWLDSARHSAQEELSVERKKAPARAERQISKRAPESRPVEERSASGSFRFPEGAELPRLERKRTEQIIRHEGYTVSYNSDYRIANWVAYELTAQEGKSRKAERSNKFVPDPLVKGATALNEDYTRSGYDRGHLAPAGDMRWSAKAMRESFFLSNITPQKPGLNRGIWKELEEQIRLWASESGPLLVATGPIITDDMRRLGKDRIGIPERFYKVICMEVGGKPRAVGFLFENRDYGDTPLRSMMIPVDSVEQVAGIDFFPALPDSVEKPMEASVHTESWSF